MGSREDSKNRGRHRGDQLRHQLTSEWRALRSAAGLSQADVARFVGVSRAVYGRIERREAADIGLRRAAIITSALGGELWLKVYPAGPPIRDAAHVALFAAFEARLGAGWRVRHEVPVGTDGRAWDRVLEGSVSIGVEGETNPGDLQALERRMQLKKRDSGVDRMILLVRSTRRNRRLLRELLPGLRATFPLGSAELLRALREGRDPGTDGLVIL